MTVREYRKGDWVGVADLWNRNPSDEFPLFGLHPQAVGQVLQRTERPGIRWLLRLARWVGRPVVSILIDEEAGQVVGSTLVNYTPEGAYVSGVVVDRAFRRQGRARAMLGYAESLARRYRRPNVVLDVLAQNGPALQLYGGSGFGRLREVLWMARELGPGQPLPPASGHTPLRPFTPADGHALAEIDNARMPVPVREILPRSPREFRRSAPTERLLQSESEAWVLEMNGRPAGYLRMTVSRLMDAANLSTPLFADAVPVPAIRDAITTALRWAESRHAARVVTWLPDHASARRPVLDDLGFVERFQILTMLHRLPA